MIPTDEWQIEMRFHKDDLWTFLNVKPTREEALQLIEKVKQDEPTIMVRLAHVIVTIQYEEKK